MTNSPSGVDLIADNTGHQTRYQGCVTHPADCQNFDGENGAREWCSKDRSEASRDAGCEQNSCVRFIQFQPTSKGGEKAAADLYGSSFTAGRATKEMCDERSDQD